MVALRLAFALVMLAVACGHGRRDAAAPATSARPAPSASATPAPAASNGAPSDTAAGFTQQTAQRLQRNIPGAEVAVSSTLTLSFKLGDAELKVNLERVHDACQRMPQECEQELVQLERALQSAATSHTLTREQLVVVVRSGEYLAQVKKIDPSVRAEPVAGELYAFAMFDLGINARNAKEEELTKLGLTPDAALKLGRENVLGRVGSVDALVERASGPWGGVSGNFYLSSMLLDSAGWASVAQRHPGRLVVGVPSVDSLFWAFGATDQDVAALRTRMQDIALHSSHPLSLEVFEWVRGKWKSLPP